MATKKKVHSGFSWNGEIGPAAIISFGGALSVLITIGWMWANQAAETKAAAKEAADAKAAIAAADKSAQRRDAVINDHSVTLGKIVTELGYVAPAIQRIESKLNAKQ